MLTFGEGQPYVREQRVGSEASFASSLFPLTLSLCLFRRSSLSRSVDVCCPELFLVKIMCRNCVARTELWLLECHERLSHPLSHVPFCGTFNLPPVLAVPWVPLSSVRSRTLF